MLSLKSENVSIDRKKAILLALPKDGFIYVNWLSSRLDDFNTV